MLAMAAADSFTNVFHASVIFISSYFPLNSQSHPVFLARTEEVHFQWITSALNCFKCCRVHGSETWAFDNQE